MSAVATLLSWTNQTAKILRRATAFGTIRQAKHIDVENTYFIRYVAIKIVVMKCQYLQVLQISNLRWHRTGELVLVEMELQ